ncbi:hypothetical protein [Phocaeicola sp.]
MGTKYKVRFEYKHVVYTELGNYLRAMVKRIHTTIERICRLSNFSISTYYKLVAGKEFPLNFYWRLGNAFLHEIADKEEKDEFLRRFNKYVACGVCSSYSIE